MPSESEIQNCKKIFLEEMGHYFDEMVRHFDEKGCYSDEIDRKFFELFYEICEKVGHTPEEKEYLKAGVHADDPSLMPEENCREGIRIFTELFCRIREKKN